MELRVDKTLPSFSIAVKRESFGEGAERIVRKVRFLDERGRYLGPVMVAKESRFVGMSPFWVSCVVFKEPILS